MRLQHKSTRVGAAAAILMLLASLTTGCMYPKELRGENQLSYRETTLLVQNAVESYQKDNGILPIITSPQSTPMYEKYRINFEPLIDGKYLSAIPSTAYEKGGTGYFMIIHEETKPAVKVMDLTTFQQVNDVQKLVDTYKSAHAGELPAGEQAYPDFYDINGDLLNSKVPTLKSVYSGEEIPFMMDKQGKVFVDYATDIMVAIQKSGKEPQGQNIDLRDLLVEASYYVPVKSTTYHWVNQQPVPINTAS
ncbi:hypothetical protein BVG16_03730 [Paenibacillus selenitireducens]|uniref:Lipoprotein n=2 Tax=Paenibacillus selenitireducens TaxID=1324314 RepID=A0A1T2XNJ9_9BACL|nr:hypothetical protein BVG16_03730 [Paenibacillus selenitireducens]